MADNPMVQYRTCLSSEIKNKPIISGSIIIASDTGEIFHDTLDGERVAIAKSIEYLDSDGDRTSILAPDSDVMYVVRSTGLIWIYSTQWICINPTVPTYFDIENVEIPANGSVVLNDNRITDTCTAVFAPINALYDLATASGVTTTCTCAAGKVTATTTCDYALIGSVKVTKP